MAARFFNGFPQPYLLGELLPDNFFRLKSTNASDQRVILLANDLEDDAILLRHALGAVGVKNPLHVVCCGQDAIDYLRTVQNNTNHSQMQLPALFLLDLQMPGLNGFDVLEWIKTQPRLANLPVVVLSTTDYEIDVKRAQKLGARSYQVKPVEYAGLKALASSLAKDWLQPAAA